MAALLHSNQEMLVRMPLIPGVNDDTSNLGAMGAFLQEHRPGVPLELMPYHRLGEAKYVRLGRVCSMEATPTPFKGDVEKAATVVSNFGITLVNR